MTNYPKRFLHVACGPARKADLIIKDFADWEETRLDIVEDFDPDIRSDMRTLTGVPDESFDGLYCSHALEHVHAFDVVKCLQAFRRVLKSDGFVFLIVPNLLGACRAIVEGSNAPFYDSPAGPIFAREVLFGKENWTAEQPFMRHLTGFTPEYFRGLIVGAGFHPTFFQADDFNILVGAKK